MLDHRENRAHVGAEDKGGEQQSVIQLVNAIFVKNLSIQHTWSGYL